MTKWEYKVVLVGELNRDSATELGDHLNTLGETGWEVVVGTIRNVLILKRPDPTQKTMKISGEWKDAPQGSNYKIVPEDFDPAQLGAIAWGEDWKEKLAEYNKGQDKE